MRIERVKLKLGAGLGLLLLLLQAQIYAQQQRPTNHALIFAAREIMTSARYCALITTDSKGRVHSRAMDPFPPEADMTVWFGTNARSRKVREIRLRPRVTLYYFNRENQEYVVVSGIARVVHDPREKEKRWKEEWKAFYPNRQTDYVLIAFRPETLELISEKKSIFGDPRTWRPPTVTFPKKAPRKLLSTKSGLD